MCEFRMLKCAGVAALLAGCAGTPSSSGSGGTSGSLGAGGSGSGGLLGSGGHRSGDAGGAGGAVIDVGIPASVDVATGCGLAGAPKGVLTDQQIVVGSVIRTYLLSVPKNYDGSTPLSLVFAWHGHGAAGNVARQQFAIEPAAAGGAIFVYPDGLGAAGDTDWDYSANGRDVQLFDTLVSHLTSTYCIDRDRIFSTGLSAGAFFTNVLGCYRGDVLRAIAPVAGGPPSLSDSNPVTCTGNVGAWVAHASNDDTVNFTTFGMATRDFWIARNGCSTQLPPVDASLIDCVEYQGCQPDLPVVFCVHTEGHTWPSMASCYDGGVCFDAGSAVWSFFARFK
jgi:polyhydroxybutyrate depolymerase